MKRNLAFFVVMVLVVSLSAVAAHADAATDATTAVLDRGIELIEAQDYAGALVLFDEAIAESGDVAEFHFYRGWALNGLFRYEEAEQAYAKAVNLEPDNARYLLEYGMTMAFFAGKFQDAYEAVDKAVALEPHNGEYIGDRGFVLYCLSRLDEALADLERSIELEPDYDNAYYFAAIVQYELGVFEEAVRYSKEYLARVPIADEVRILLGDAQFELGNYAEALVAYDETISGSGITAEDIVNYTAAKEQAVKPPALQTYSIDKETIPSIDSIVGFREIVNTEAGFSISLGGSFVVVNYRSASVQADLQAYIDLLIDSGWACTAMEGDVSGGTIQLAHEATQDGKLLIVTCEYTAHAYSIRTHSADAALKRNTDDAGNKWGEIISGGASDTLAATSAPAASTTPAEPDDIVGVWYLTEVVLAGSSMSPDQIGMQVTMTLADDSTAVLQISGEEDEIGVWVIADGLVVVTVNEDRVFALSDGNLSAEQDGMKMVFGKEKTEGEAFVLAPVRTDSALADFNGVWSAFYADYLGMTIPIEAFGIEASLTINNGIVNANIGGSAQLNGDVVAGVLTVSGVDEGGTDVVMPLILHEDGIMSCVLDESLTLYFLLTGK